MNESNTTSSANDGFGGAKAALTYGVIAAGSAAALLLLVRWVRGSRREPLLSIRIEPERGGGGVMPVLVGGISRLALDFALRRAREALETGLSLDEPQDEGDRRRKKASADPSRDPLDGDDPVWAESSIA